jgi:hypothetical protein
MVSGKNLASRKSAGSVDSNLSMRLDPSSKRRTRQGRPCTVVIIRIGVSWHWWGKIVSHGIVVYNMALPSFFTFFLPSFPEIPIPQ